MPVVPPNRGDSSQNQKPPWARDSSNQQRPVQEVPWRKNLKPGPTSQKQDSGSDSSKPGSSKLQINLKAVKKPEKKETPAEKVPSVKLNPVPATKADDGPKVIREVTTIPIQRVKSQAQDDTAKLSSKRKQSATTMPKDASVPVAPPPPPMPPGAPPPPPPPPPPGMASKPPRPPHVQAKIEQLRKPSRKRPDFGQLMKEIEQGRKLKHVQCNDRSKPIIPRMKSYGKFVFDSEAKPANKTDAIHHKLLQEIQGGVRLKKVQCNDRSKPILSGLRKMRRQVTLEENQKTGDAPIQEETPEELTFVDDIDILRDELQSSKQMLEMEIENKVNLEKKNRDMKCQIITMEAEINTLKAQLGLVSEDEVSMISKGLDQRGPKSLRKSGSGLWKSPSIVGIKKSKSGINKDMTRAQEKGDEEELQEVNELEEEVNSLRNQVKDSKKAAEEWEAKYKEAMQKLLVAQGQLEDSEQKRVVLEKKLDKTSKQKGIPTAAPCESRWTQTEEQILGSEHRRVSRQVSQQQQTPEAANGGPSSYNYAEEESEEEDSSELEVDEETVQRKKQEREIKLWENKLRSVKEKQHASKTERRNLKAAQKNLERDLKNAKLKHKELQKEVDKMAKMMMKEAEKDDDENSDDEEEDQEESDEEAEEEESEESEEETESEEDDDEDETSSEEDDEAMSHEDRLGLFSKRIKRRENVLNALRKGNYLLRANIDRLRDEMDEERIRYQELEHELNTVLADV